MAKGLDAPRTMKVPDAPPPESGSYLEDYLRQQEGIERVPKIELTFFFGSHKDKADADLLYDQMKEADVQVLLFENYMADLEDTAHFQRLIDNPSIVQPSLEKVVGFYREFVTRCRTDKLKFALGCADVPGTSTLSSKIQFINSAMSRFVADLHQVDKPFDEAAKIFTDTMRVESRTQRMREQFFMTTLGSEIARLLRERPGLADEKTLRIGLFWGQGHAHLYDTIKKNHQSTEHVFLRKETIRNHMVTVEDKFLENPDYVPTPEESSDAFITVILGARYLAPAIEKTLTSQEVYSYIKGIVDKMSKRDKEMTYRLTQAAPGNLLLTIFFDEWLRKKGIPTNSDGPERIRDYLSKLK